MGKRKSSMRMWGYIPAASLRRAPILQPTRAPIRGLQEEVGSVCTGGCGFAIAITESGKLITWGSTNDLGQSDNLRGSQQEQEERVEPYLLDLNEKVVHAAGGWAHSVAATDKGYLCTWGWRACALTASMITEKTGRLLPTSSGQGDDGSTPFPPSVWTSECSTGSESQEAFKKIGASIEHYRRFEQSETALRDHLSCSDEIQSELPTQRLANSKGAFRSDRIVNSFKQSALDMGESPSVDNSSSMEDNVISLPWLVYLGVGVIITSVAAGGRHTLALSDTGKVWGWGYGEEGQLGLGSRLTIMATPQVIQSLEPPICINDGSGNQKESVVADVLNRPDALLGTRVARIACGGRHSAVLTGKIIQDSAWSVCSADSGAVLTFGWGLYGQCGQGSTEDQLSPVYVSALGGMKVTGVSAGLWHTVFITHEGDAYSSGGNQFGQLGILGDQAEMLPTLVDAPVLENETAISVSCGARHTAILTDKGKIFCWGWNKYGQLGTGDTVDRDTPVEVLMDNAVARSMACGWWHTLALVEEDLF